MNGWQILTLEQLLETPLINGRSVPTQEGGFPVLRLTALRSSRVDLRERKSGAWTKRDAERFLVRLGDFLVARGNGSLALVGRGGLVDVEPDEVAFPDTMIRIRPNPRLVLPRYLSLLWNSPTVRAQIESMARTTAGIYKVNQRHLANIRLPIPGSDQQRRIVDVLEDHLSRLDTAEHYLSTSLTHCESLDELMLAARLNVIDAPQTRLSRLLSDPLANGRSVRTRAGGFPVLRLTALHGDFIDLTKRKEGDWSSDEASRFLVARGDFLLARGNGSLRLVGRGALVIDQPDPVAFPDTMIRLRPHADLLDPLFFSHVWNSMLVRRQIESMARTTAGIYKVNQKQLAHVKIPAPSLEVQRKIAAAVHEQRSTLRSLTVDVTRARVHGEALRRSLLAAAFSGRLTGRSSDIDLREEELAPA